MNAAPYLWFCFSFCHSTFLSLLFKAFYVLNVRWTHLWMADKPAGSVEQSHHFVCAPWDNEGHFPWQLKLGLIFILCVDLSPKELKAQWRIFVKRKLEPGFSLRVWILFSKVAKVRRGWLSPSWTVFEAIQVKPSSSVSAVWWLF